MRRVAIPSLLYLLVLTSGCAAPRAEFPVSTGSVASSPSNTSSADFSTLKDEFDKTIQLVAAQSLIDAGLSAERELNIPEADSLPSPAPVAAAPEPGIRPPVPHVEFEQIEPEVLTLDNVLRSVYESYPLLQVAVEQRGIAAGELLAANGEFDTKLKGEGIIGPLGFYETNRFGVGVDQPLFGGGQVFAGYRIGRGNFQPWFGERETNDGGEVKAGFLIPLRQNRVIDARRAAIFRAVLVRDAVEPDVFLQLIEFVRAASHSYFDWVSTGQEAEIAQSLLDIALQRQDNLQKRVDRGDLPRIELTDNQRMIVTRRSALIDAQRKFEQAGVKLSLFLRTPNGQPVVVDSERLPSDFPDPPPYDDAQVALDIQSALERRPELQYLGFVRKQLEVDLRQARNLYKPELDLGLVASQDMGAAASSKRDKSPFELEAALAVAVPVQRRKAVGKIRAIQGKLAQVSAKQGFAADKISAEVRNAVLALTAAHRRIDQARQSVELNQAMEQAERRRFDQGDSTLLVVNLRELATADARTTWVKTLLEYFKAAADLRAAMATIPDGESATPSS